MPRASKSATLLDKNNHTADKIKKKRKEIENQMIVAGEVTASKYLSKKQSEIFDNIVEYLKNVNIVSSIDKYTIETFAIAIDRLQTIETMINKDITNLSDKGLMSAKDKYSKDFYRCANELCLSPQARAKFANTVANAQKEVSLAEILKDED